MSLIYKIALTLINNVGDVIARNLLDHFGTPEAIFKAKKKALMEIPGIGLATANHILNSDALVRAAKQLKFIEKHQVKVLFFSDSDYPRRLRECADAPILLYYKGNADLNHHRIVSIVGTRRATDYGKQLCRQLAEVLSAYDVLIVSGLAYGIDVAAHKEALHFGIPTVGVLGHGLDRLYPSLHKSVAQKMVLNGGLLTEFSLDTVPDRENFPKRNRIIAGIADVTIVVEATTKGGALITAELANSYHRDVYTFPGRTTDEYSQGCNFLIKTNRAGLINHARDLVYYLGWEEVRTTAQNLQVKLPLGLNKEEIQVVELLKIAPALIDEISNKINLPQSKLAIHLLNLEMQGILTTLPGKVYKLN
jgi:DNA processing protein